LLVEGIGEELEFCCICAAGQKQPGNYVYSVLRSPSKCFCLPPSGGIHRSKQLSAISSKLEVRFLSKLNRFNMGR
jgi:hypothetical protein